VKSIFLYVILTHRLKSVSATEVSFFTNAHFQNVLSDAIFALREDDGNGIFFRGLYKKYVGFSLCDMCGS
jgi:hypothetical protein